MLIAAYQSAPCPKPGKQRYCSEAEAQVAADYLFDTQQVTLEPYHCPCGLWHLTTPMGLKGTQQLTWLPDVIPPRRKSDRKLRRPSP